MLENKKVGYSIVMLTLFILLSIAGYYIYDNRGVYGDIAGEWKVKRDELDEENINELIYKMYDQLAEKLELPNTESTKISRDGKVTITKNNLNILKDESHYSLPQERDKNSKKVPITFEFSEIEESPIYKDFFIILLERNMNLKMKYIPFNEKELTIFEEMLDIAKYSEKDLTRLTELRKADFEENPDSYKNISIVDNKLKYKMYLNNENDSKMSFRIVNKNKIEFIAEDGETIMATFVRK